MTAWLDEPNTLEFLHRDLRCVMLRHQEMKHWCGYVGVGPEHPLYGLRYSDTVLPPQGLLERPFDIDKVGAINVLCATAGSQSLEDGCDLVLLLDVHGGLSYSSDHYPGVNASGDWWWFGFDCAHAGDLSPGMHADLVVHGEYRDAEYVEAECRSLAVQLADWPGAQMSARQEEGQ